MPETLMLNAVIHSGHNTISFFHTTKQNQNPFCHNTHRNRPIYTHLWRAKPTSQCAWCNQHYFFLYFSETPQGSSHGSSQGEKKGKKETFLPLSMWISVEIAATPFCASHIRSCTSGFLDIRPFLSIGRPICAVNSSLLQEGEGEKSSLEAQSWNLEFLFESTKKSLTEKQ